jgi:hypothetical protein
MLHLALAAITEVFARVRVRSPTGFGFALEVLPGLSFAQ